VGQWYSSPFGLFFVGTAHAARHTFDSSTARFIRAATIDSMSTFAQVRQWYSSPFGLLFVGTAHAVWHTLDLPTARFIRAATIDPMVASAQFVSQIVWKSFAHAPKTATARCSARTAHRSPCT